METLSNDRSGVRARGEAKQKNPTTKSKKPTATKAKAKKVLQASAAVMLRPVDFRRFEKWMKEPGGPTEAILRGAAMLRSHYPKGR